MYKLNFSVVFDRFPDLLWGCVATLVLAASGMALAMVIGLIGVLMRRSNVPPLRWIAMTFVELIRNTPFLVQIFFLFFAMPFMGIRISPTSAAVIALGVNGGAYAIEIIRGGVDAIPKGQTEAGFALGLSKGQIFRFIILKPALRTIYPALTGQFIMLTLTSSICSSIAAYELTSVAQRIDSETFRSLEIYLVITLMYLAISWIVMAFFAAIGRRSFDYPVK
ncbi:amino acid ABC transporter permease [Pseudochelatococcus sp. B33]